MLIGICGSKCAGKSTVAQYLIAHHGFKRLHLAAAGGAGDAAEGDSGLAGPDGDEGTTPLPARPAGKKPEPQQQQQQHRFATAGALLDFVTRNWRSRWVTTDVHDEAVLDALSRRPFFLLLSVDAPLMVRWERYRQKAGDEKRHRWDYEDEDEEDSKNKEIDGAASLPPPPSSSLPSRQQKQHHHETLEAFVRASDASLYSPSKTTGGGGGGGGGGVLQLMSRASVRLLNTSSDLAHLYATLGKLDLTDPARLRPSWDDYFMSLASLAARRCNCMKRAVGCVLVDGQRRVISTGYNGTPRHLRNCGDGGCPRCNAGDVGSGVGLQTCLCLHAEENALLEAGRDRISRGGGGDGGGGCVLYCNTCPCLTCSIKIVQVGISEVVYSQGYSMDGDTAEVFRSAGIKLRQFSPPVNGLIHLEVVELH